LYIMCQILICMLNIWTNLDFVFVSDIGIFVLKRDVKLQLTNRFCLATSNWAWTKLCIYFFLGYFEFTVALFWVHGCTFYMRETLKVLVDFKTVKRLKKFS